MLKRNDGNAMVKVFIDRLIKDIVSSPNARFNPLTFIVVRVLIAAIREWNQDLIDYIMYKLTNEGIPLDQYLKTLRSAAADVGNLELLKQLNF
jgi:hypothetical protein